MKVLLSSLALLSALLPAWPARADVFGLWRLQGSLSGVTFILDCNFTPQRIGMGGTCTGAPNGDPRYSGKVYTLEHGIIAGEQVSWSYPSSYMFLTFDLHYIGTMNGNEITGTVTAAGRNGAFIAVRE